MTQGANQAAGAAKLGHPTHFVGQVRAVVCLAEANKGCLLPVLPILFSANVCYTHMQQVATPSSLARVITNGKFILSSSHVLCGRRQF
jgi:hypothetical protein